MADQQPSPGRRVDDQPAYQRQRRRHRIESGVLGTSTVLLVALAVGLGLNSRADSRERKNNRVESQRSCQRSYKVGPDFARLYIDAQRRGIVMGSTIRAYVGSIPGISRADLEAYKRDPRPYPPLPKQTKPIEEACP